MTLQTEPHLLVTQPYLPFSIWYRTRSHCKRDEPAFMNSCAVAISNSTFSFISGFAVFATLGHLALLEGHDSVSKLEYSSFELVFGSWPVALGTVTGGEHFVRLFFVMLFFLGIDSAFSFMEAFLTVLHDSKLNLDRKWASIGLAVSAFLFSLLYASDAGLIFLDTIDYYINFVMLFVGFLKCFTVGWMYKIEEQIKSLGAQIVLTYIATTYLSIIFACCLWFGLGGVSSGFVGLALSYGVGMGFVRHLLARKKQANPAQTLKGMYYDLMLKNVMDLRSDLSEVVGYIPSIWCLLIKHFIPPVLLILFFLGANATITDDAGNTVKEFGHYGNYATKPYQVLGISAVVFAGFFFASSLVFPRLYDALHKKEESIVEIEIIKNEHKSTETQAKDYRDVQDKAEGHLA
mmetsp:Transcript_32568/g.68804  ORF Transcript_32568/g.68804 Transcript_32568/m.68804 type:complete len:405 (+) Transcript_32568:142-1356(+)